MRVLRHPLVSASRRSVRQTTPSLHKFFAPGGTCRARSHGCLAEIDRSLAFESEDPPAKVGSCRSPTTFCCSRSPMASCLI